MVQRTFPVRPAVEDRGNGASSAGGVETLPRFGLSEFDGATGRLWLSYVTPSVPATVGRLMVASAGTAATGVTLARLAVFAVADDGALTKIAQTASDTTIGAGTYTPYERVLATAGGWPATVLLAAGRRYALGFLQVASGPMKVQGAFILDSGTEPVPSRYVDGQADVADTYAAGAATAHFTIAYLRGRP